MIRLAICDDSIIESEKILSLISEYPQKSIFTEPMLFSSPETLLTYQSGSLPFDLYLLDIVMPNMSGIELAMKIRVIQQNCVIIFFTTSPEFALEAYSVSALQYLMKPVTTYSLYPALDKAIKWIGKKDKTLTIDSKIGLIPVFVQDIRYVEYVNHILYYHLNDKVIMGKSIRVNFSEALPSLFSDEAFVLTHRAFLVNMNHIRKMTNDSFYLDNGEYVPIAKTRLAIVRTEYLSYLVKR